MFFTVRKNQWFLTTSLFIFWCHRAFTMKWLHFSQRTAKACKRQPWTTCTYSSVSDCSWVSYPFEQHYYISFSTRSRVLIHIVGTPNDLQRGELPSEYNPTIETICQNIGRDGGSLTKKSRDQGFKPQIRHPGLEAFLPSWTACGMSYYSWWACKSLLSGICR